MDDVIRGQVVAVNPEKDLMLGAFTGLVSKLSGWLKVELVGESELLDFKRERGLEPTVFTDHGAGVDNKASSGAEEDDGDARTLFVDYDEQDLRHKPWRKVCMEAREYQFSDWAHEGPATVLFLIKQMERSGGNPKLWLDIWSRARGVAENDRAKHELRCLCEVLQNAGSLDCLNLPALSCVETVSRRIQSIVDAYSAAGSSGVPDWSNAKLFSSPLSSKRGRLGVEKKRSSSTTPGPVKELTRGGQPSIETEAAAVVAEGKAPPGGPGARRRGEAEGAG